MSEQYEYGEVVLDEWLEGVSGDRDTDTDAADADGEEFEGVSIGADGSSGGDDVDQALARTARA
jgi:hypothetical protein